MKYYSWGKISSLTSVCRRNVKSACELLCFGDEVGAVPLLDKSSKSNMLSIMKNDPTFCSRDA